MSLVTVTQTIPQPPLQVATTDVVTFRGWYTNSFVAADGVTPVEGGNGQDGFYYKYDCTINGSGYVVIPAITIQPTTESNPTAGFFGAVFVNDALERMVFGQPQATAGWQIPTTFGSVTNWGELAVYNMAAQLVYPPITYSTTDQVILLIKQLGGGNFQYAAVGINGISQPSVPPVDPTRPIFFGQNDPAVGDLRGTLTTSRVPRASGAKTLGDSQITDDGTNVGVQTRNYVQLGDYNLTGNGSRLEVNDTFALMNALAGGAAGAYAGAVGNCSGSDPVVQVQTTGQSHVYGTTKVTTLGDGSFDVNGVTIRIYNRDGEANQLVLWSTRPAVPNDTLLFVSEMCQYMDEGANKLKFRLRLSDGTYATAELAFTRDP